VLLSGSSPFKSANRSNLRLAGTEQIVLRGIDMMKWGWVDKEIARHLSLLLQLCLKVQKTDYSSSAEIIYWLCSID